jgi:hypothetical protein
MPSAHPHDLCRAATARIAAGDPAGGEQLLAGALALLPDDPNLLYVAGNCALARGDEATALDRYERSVAAAPSFVAALVNLGFVLRLRQRLPEARAALRRAVTLEPGHALAWANLVSTYVNEGEPAAGEVVAREALALHPGAALVHWNLALLLLEQGKWREGFAEYRHRFDTPVVPLPPAMRGIRRLEDPDQLAPGDLAVVHGEQGLGDEILFAGLLAEFVAAADRRGARVALRPHPRLAGLFARTFALPEWHGTGGTDTPTWYVPIGDLPHFFRATDDAFPRRRGYLAVDRVAVARLRSTLATDGGDRPLVGIAWRGGSAYTHAVHRTIPLDTWLPLLRQPARFVSLAYHDAAAEITAARAAHGIDLVDAAALTRAHDYERTCELVAALDLVITVPTSVHHAAGAVGTPCWVVMDERAAWRECGRGTTNPWYPLTHRRFVRPRDAHGWHATLNEVAMAFSATRDSPPLMVLR